MEYHRQVFSNLNCNIPVTLAESGVYSDIPSRYPLPVPPSSLAKNIRRLRRQADLTQAALGDRLGVGQGAVSKWESGETEPDASALPQLALIVGALLDDVLEGVDPQYDSRRDLLRQARDQRLGSHLGGPTDVPASAERARLRELEQQAAELAALKARFSEVQDVARRLFAIAVAGEEGRATARPAASRRRPTGTTRR